MNFAEVTIHIIPLQNADSHCIDCWEGPRFPMCHMQGLGEEALSPTQGLGSLESVIYRHPVNDGHQGVRLLKTMVV